MSIADYAADLSRIEQLCATYKQFTGNSDLLERAKALALRTTMSVEEAAMSILNKHRKYQRSNT